MSNIYINLGIYLIFGISFRSSAACLPTLWRPNFLRREIRCAPPGARALSLCRSTRSPLLSPFLVPPSWCVRVSLCVVAGAPGVGGRRQSDLALSGRSPPLAQPSSDVAKARRGPKEEDEPGHTDEQAEATGAERRRWDRPLAASSRRSACWLTRPFWSPCSSPTVAVGPFVHLR